MIEIPMNLYGFGVSINCPPAVYGGFSFVSLPRKPSFFHKESNDTRPKPYVFIGMNKFGVPMNSQVFRSSCSKAL